MRCPICNHETADGSMFCGFCGAKLSGYKKAEGNAPKQEEQPTDESVDTAPANQETQSDSTALNDNSFIFESNDQPSQTQNEQSGITIPYAQQQTDFAIAFASKKRSKRAVFAIIAVILVVAAGALYFSGVFDAGPLTSIVKASDKTARSKCFDVNIEIAAQNGTLTMDGTVLFDPASEIIEFYFIADMPRRDESVVLLLKDNILIEDDGYVDSNDISKFLNEFWDEYNTYNKSDVKLSDLLKTLGVSSNQVDFDQFDMAVDDFIKNLNDKNYINEKLGTFEKTTENGTTNYNFEFKSRDVSIELIDVFGESFKLEDEDDKADAEDDLYNGLKEAFGSKFELNFNVKNGYLTGFNFLSYSVEIELELSNLDKSEIDESKFEKYESYLKEASGK